MENYIRAMLKIGYPIDKLAKSFGLCESRLNEIAQEVMDVR